MKKNMPRTRRLLALLILLAQGGCDKPPDGPVSTRELVGDTLTVEIEGARADTATLNPVWRARILVGQEKSKGPEGRAPVEAMALDASGRLVAAVGGRLFRVSWDGSKLERLVRAPRMGEITGLAGLPDGTLVVRADSVDRILLLEETGSLLGEDTLRLGPPLDHRDALVVSDSGNLFVGLGPRYRIEEASRRPLFLSMNSRLQALDTLFLPAHLSDACPFRPRRHFRAGRFEDLRARYYPMARWTLHPAGYLVAGCPEAYRFELLRPHTPLLRVQMNATPVRVPVRERHAFQGSWVKQMQYGFRGELWGWEGPPVPEEKPFYHRLLAAGGGRVWVWPSAPSVPTPTPETWALAGLPDTIWVEDLAGTFDVFDPEGELEGHVRLPAEIPYSPFLDIPDPIVRGDTIWAVTRDSTAAVSLARYRVHWPDPGAEEIPAGGGRR